MKYYVVVLLHSNHVNIVQTAQQVSSQKMGTLKK